MLSAGIFRQAAALGVGTAGYALWGSSAGARMAANIGSHGAAAYGGGDLPGPAAVIMAYTAHADRVAVLRQSGTPVEFRVSPGLGHGFGLGTGTAAAGWSADAIRFWSSARPAAR